MRISICAFYGDPRLTRRTSTSAHKHVGASNAPERITSVAPVFVVLAATISVAISVATDYDRGSCDIPLSIVADTIERETVKRETVKQLRSGAIR